MTTDPFGAAIAAEHRGQLLRNAADYRQQRAVRRGQRRRRRPTLSLRVRPARPTDAQAVAGLFEQLSLDSRLARFLHPKQTITLRELRAITLIDHRDRETLLAVTRLRRRVLGVASFVRDAQNPSAAEVGVMIADAWQERRVGSRLVARLVERARAEGISQFTAVMFTDNARARRLLSDIGPVEVVDRDGPTISVRVALRAAGQPVKRHAGVLTPRGT
jgi:RimJ/RimL family protein N-acetyltransferase